MTPALERREAQAVPTTPADAEASFRCEAYLCTMRGAYCRDQHLHAIAAKPENRDACIGCRAGAARARLLGGTAAGAIVSAACTATTTRGTQCTHPPVTDGLCHHHRAKGSVKTAQHKRKSFTARALPTTAPSPMVRPTAPRDVSERREVSEAAAKRVRSFRDAVVILAAVEAPKAPGVCLRVGCQRPASPGSRASEFCAGCWKSAYVNVRKANGERPVTDEDRKAWLMSTPVRPTLRGLKLAATKGWAERKRTSRENRAARDAAFGAAPFIPAGHCGSFSLEERP